MENPESTEITETAAALCKVFSYSKLKGNEFTEPPLFQNFEHRVLNT